MAQRLGTAYIGIEADGSMFRATALAAMKKATTGLKAEIPITAATKRASTQIRRLLAEIALANPTLKVNLDADNARVIMRDLRGRVLAVGEELDKMRANPDITRDALRGVAGLQLAVKNLASQMLKAKVSPQSLQKMEYNVLNLEGRFDHLTTSVRKFEDGIKDSAKRTEFFKTLEPRITALADHLNNMKADIKDRAFLAKIARMEASLTRLSGRKVDISEQGFAKALADLAALEAGGKALEQELGHMNDRLTHGKVAWFGWIGGLLNARVALFAGARQVTGWHIALDSVVETLAILVPALTVLTAGLGAFGAAAYLAQDTLTRIGNHMKYVHQVSEATGKVIPPLTDHFDKMAGVIRPQVFQLLGAALGGAGKQLGLFDRLATGTGALLDRFAARVIVDMESGKGGIEKFVKTGEYQLKNLGVIFVNVGHVIAQLARVAAETGIAEKLSLGLAGFSNILRVIADLPVPILAAIAGLHGLYLWSGLATSALVKLGLGPLRGLANIAAGADRAGTAVKGMDKDAGSLKRIKAYASDIGTGFGALPAHIKDVGKSLLKLAQNPWTWAAAGVVAIGALAYVILTSKDATDRFIDSMNRLVTTSTLFNVINNTGAALIKTNQQLAASVKELDKEADKAKNTQITWAGAQRAQGPVMNAQRQDIANLVSEHKNLYSQLKLETSRLSEVSQKFGATGLAGAMALAALAGVKVSALLSNDQRVWATAVQQITDLIHGYNAMGQGANQLGFDLNALTVEGSDQVKQIEQLNNQIDAFTKTVAAPVTNFLAFDQTLIRFGQDAQKAGAHMTGLGGGIQVASKKVKTSSIQLQQDFQDAFNAAEQLFDAMRSSQAPAAQQQEAIKRTVEVLIPLAGTNKAAAAEISALAQEAGGPATTNLRTLARWAGKTKDPIGALDKVSQDAAIGFSNMSLDAQKLGTILSQDLAADMGKAVENAIGLQGAMNKYAIDLRNGTEATAQGHKDRQALWKDFVLVTGSGKQADALIAAMTDRLHGHGDALASTKAARKLFNDDLQKILDKAPGAKNDVKHLADATQFYGDTGDKTKAARQKIYMDLRQAGVDAKTAHRLVDEMQKSIDALHGKSLKIVMQANGSVNVTSGKSTWNISQGAWFSPHAEGGFISGGKPGKDSVPAMLMPGEVVVPTKMVAKGAVDHLRGRLPGFATGGRVQSFASGGLAGTPDTWPGQMQNQVTSVAQHETGKAASAAAAAAVKAAIKAALTTGSGPAVLQYAMGFLHKVPYVWGGSTPAGWDCSGMVSYIYDHFGLFHGRTDAEGFRRWARPSAPTPGGLAFYGRPAHHVGFVVDNNTLLSALGHAWGTTLSGLRMGDNSGYGIPPQGFGQASGGGGGVLPKNKLQELAFSLLASHGWGGQWPAFNSLEMREAGWNMLARNPSSGAYGLAQFILGPSEYYTYGGNPNTGIGQLTAMMNYIAQRYGDPNAAWAHEIGFGWYGKGGQVPGYATGGAVKTVKDPGGPAAITALRKRLAGYQSHEVADYTGLRRAFLKGPKKYLNKITLGDLATLARRQSAEQAAYKKLSGAGLTVANLNKLSTAAKAEDRTAHDKWLNRKPGGHPGWAHGLEYWLGMLSSQAKKGLPGGQQSTGPGGKGLPQITHTFGGDVGNTIAAKLASALSPLGAASGGMVPMSYDRGGWLKPGYTLAHNGTGRPEPVGGAGTVNITFEVGSNGSQFDQFMMAWLRKNVKVQGGGDTQTAFGQPNIRFVRK